MAAAEKTRYELIFKLGNDEPEKFHHRYMRHVWITNTAHTHKHSHAYDETHSVQYLVWIGNGHDHANKQLRREISGIAFSKRWINSLDIIETTQATSMPATKEVNHYQRQQQQQQRRCSFVLSEVSAMISSTPCYEFGWVSRVTVPSFKVPRTCVLYVLSWQFELLSGR